MIKTLSYTLLFSLVLLASCKNDTKSLVAKEGYKIYETDSLGFSIEYPQIFEPKEYIRPELPLAFYEVNNDSANYLFHPNMLMLIETLPLVQIYTTEYTVGEAMKLKLQLQSKYPDFNTYDTDSMEVNGVKIGMFKYDAPINDSVTFTSKQYLVLQKGRAFHFQGTTNATLFEEYEKTFDDMIKSLIFKKQ